MDNKYKLSKSLDKDGKLFKQVQELFGEEVFPTPVKVTGTLQDWKQMSQTYKTKRNRVLQGMGETKYSPYEIAPVRFTDDKFALRSYAYSVNVEGTSNPNHKYRAMYEKGLITWDDYLKKTGAE